MKNIFKRVLVFLLIFSFSVAPISPSLPLLNISQAANIKIESLEPVIWDTDKSIDGWVRIMPDSKLIIKEGADINFTAEYGGITVMGELVIEGSKDNPTTLTKSTDCNFYVGVEEGASATIKNAEIIGGGYDVYLSKGISNRALAGEKIGAIDVNGGNVRIEDITFENSTYAVVVNDNLNGDVQINYSKFKNNNFDVIDYNQSDFRYNYWDSFVNDMDFCMSNQSVKNCLTNSEGDFDFSSWQENENFIHGEGASNVLFLPGIKASHLYKYDNDGDEDQLWVPNWFGDDVEELELDEYGASKEKVFTKEGDVLKDTIMGNLYESFLGDLSEMKDADEINDYNAFAYDWRQSVEDIAKNGTSYEGQTKFVIDKIVSLAQSSKSKKVTIVAHSNGGLVAKAAMIELEKQGLVDRVDKIILVGTPQMGTPLSILSFLYGYDESLPSLLSQQEARKLIENMPGAYGLLPSRTYLNRLIDDKIIDFPLGDSERGKMFKDAYGENIGSFDEFRDFLLASVDKREKPESEMVSQENILNEKLLDEAIILHDNLDNWKVPAGIKLIQLAGWGLPTVSGINYVEKKETECKHNLGSSVPVCYDGEDYVLVPEPKFTVDGDKVVTTPSGLMMDESDNVERYWFDLYSYDTPENIGRKHKDILESSSIRNVIKNKIQNKDSALPEYISKSRPEDYENAKPRIRMSLYSPLDIHLYSGSNHTGPKEIIVDGGVKKMIEENIPNSYYLQLGERKYVGFDKDEDVEIILDGYDEGGYTLKIEEVEYAETGEEIINHITFKNLPASENTQVKLTIPASGLKDVSNLEADYDGDGNNDYILKPVLNEEVTIVDNTHPLIKIISPENRKYLKNENMDIKYEISDDKSDSDNIQRKVLLDDKLIVEDKLDLSLLKLGEHKLRIEAVDEVGNTTVEGAIFNIHTDIYALEDNINHFYDLGLIKSNQERKMLINNLKVIKKEIEFYNSIKNNIFIKKKVKNILLEIIENQIQNHINIIKKKIEQDKKSYDIIIKKMIIDDLEFIKINIK